MCNKIISILIKLSVDISAPFDFLLIMGSKTCNNDEYESLVIHFEDDDCPTLALLDDDDGVNVIIDRVEELRRINHIMDESDIYTVDQNDDLAINAELQELVSESINPKTLKCVTVRFQNQIILIPNTREISSRLASLLWSYPKPYTKSTLPSHAEFTKNINRCRESGKLWSKTYPHDIPFSAKIGIFAVKYKKNIIAPDIGVPNLNVRSASTTRDDEGFKHSSSGVYQYCDFALLIIENGVIIDYAVHGFRSNINECVRIHNPVKVFYNASPGDALDVFMKYPYQPFYPALSGVMQAVKIYRLSENFNSMAFCERNDIYCALCSALRDFRGMLFQAPQQKLKSSDGLQLKYVEKPYIRKWHNTRRSVYEKNQYGQPMHNAHRLKMYKAPKMPTRFKPYLKK
nr:gp78-like protein [Oryctes rhinoceros nudivirus]